jgi:bifunctional oligoribonuclease and PAP phosphatase NrnA
MKSKGRPKRVGELIRHEIARLLTRGLKDPRIGFVSVMEVRMSPDLQFANVYVSLMGTEAECKSSLIALRNSAGWIRREVGKHLHIRVTPQIRFFPDDTLDQVYHLEEVLEQIHEEQAQTPMIQIDLPGVLEELRGYDRVLITTHVNPDGDAVGSMLGLAQLMGALGCSKVSCVLHDPVPKLYQDLPGAKTVLVQPKSVPEVDAVLVVDVASRERIGSVLDPIGDGKRLLVLDHHLGDGMSGAIGCVDASFAATGEMVAELFQLAEIPLSLEAAHCLYVAQATDTGGYRYSNTSVRSHRIAASFLETGLEAAPICERIFNTMSKATFALLRTITANMDICAEGKLAHTYVTQEDLKAADATKEDLDNLVNFARNIEGVEVGALFCEREPGVCKVSLRAAPTLNAAEFLGGYGGGGHAAAAGATLEGPLAEVQQEMVARLESVLLEKEEGDAS